MTEQLQMFSNVLQHETEHWLAIWKQEHANCHHQTEGKIKRKKKKTEKLHMNLETHAKTAID